MIDQIRYYKRRMNPAEAHMIRVHDDVVYGTQIGTGMYSVAYRLIRGRIKGVDVSGTVLLATGCEDISKEIIAKLEKKMKLPYMPQIVSLGTYRGSCWYLMPYYKNIEMPAKTEKEKKAEQIFKELYGMAFSEHGDNAIRNIREAKVPLPLKKSLITVMNELIKHDPYTLFDIGRSNVGIDEQGNFVCRDCFASDVRSWKR